MNHQHDDAKLMNLLKMLLQTLQIIQTKLLDSFCLRGMGRVTQRNGGDLNSSLKL